MPAADPDIADFLQHMQHVRNLSPHTLRAYTGDLVHFTGWLTSCGVTRVAAVDRDTLRSYAMALHSQLAPSSVGRRLATIRSLFKHLRRIGSIDADVTVGLRNPKKASVLPNVLSVEEVLALLRLAPGPRDDRIAHRDRALLELIYGAGVRVSEAVGLNVGDVDLPQRQAKVMGKGRKERFTPFGEHAEHALAGWLNVRDAYLEGRVESAGRPLFLNSHRGRLSARSVHRLLEKRCLNAGLLKTVGPHALRHSFATHLLDGGAGIREVQELLGHEQLSTTQRYTHVSLVSMQRSYDSAHPRASLQDSEALRFSTEEAL